MHGYVVPSRIGTFARTTLQLEFSVYSGKKNHVKNKYVKNLELINKFKKKHGSEVVNALRFERSGPGFDFRRLWSYFSATHQNKRIISSAPATTSTAGNYYYYHRRTT